MLGPYGRLPGAVLRCFQIRPLDLLLFLPGGVQIDRFGVISAVELAQGGVAEQLFQPRAAGERVPFGGQPFDLGKIHCCVPPIR